MNVYKLDLWELGGLPEVHKSRGIEKSLVLFYSVTSLFMKLKMKPKSDIMCACVYISIRVNNMTTCLSKCQNSPEPTNSSESPRCAVVSGSGMLSADTVASMDQNCLSSTPLTFLLRLRSEKFNSSQANTSTWLLYSSIPEPFLPRCRAHYAWKKRVFMVCNKAQVGETCQSKMDSCLCQLALSSLCILVTVCTNTLSST